MSGILALFIQSPRNNKEMKIHYVDARCFRYATESSNKVIEAIQYLLPPETQIDRSTTEGHYGDKIEIYTARIENADGVRHILDTVSHLLNDDTDAEERVDEDCTFHLRIDKQSAYNQEPSLGEGIDLSMKMEAYPAKKHKAVDAVEETIEKL